MATISLDEEVRLYSTNAEREKINRLATLFGMITAVDYLERAYVRDSVSAIAPNRQGLSKLLRRT